MSDLTSKIIDYEAGLLSDSEIIQLFQELIDNGMAWTLQGSYGRMANALIEGGYCKTKGGNKNAKERAVRVFNYSNM